MTDITPPKPLPRTRSSAISQLRSTTTIGHEQPQTPPRRARSVNENKNRKIEGLESQLKALEEENNNLKNRLEIKENDISLLNHQSQLNSAHLGQVNKEISAISQQYQLSSTHLNKAKRDNQDLYMQLSNKTEQCSKAELSIKHLENELIKQQSLIANHKETIQSRDIEIKQLKTKIEIIPVLQNQVNSYQTVYQAERRAREEQVWNIQKMEKELERSQQDAVRLQKKLDEVKSENERLREALNSNFQKSPVGSKFGQSPQRQEEYPQWLNQLPFQHQQFQQQHLPLQQQQQQKQQQKHQHGFQNQHQDLGPETVTSLSSDDMQKRCPICKELFPDLDSLQIHLNECN